MWIYCWCLLKKSSNNWFIRGSISIFCSKFSKINHFRLKMWKLTLKIRANTQHISEWINRESIRLCEFQIFNFQRISLQWISKWNMSRLPHLQIKWFVCVRAYIESLTNKQNWRHYSQWLFFDFRFSNTVSRKSVWKIQIIEWISINVEVTLGSIQSHFSIWIDQLNQSIWALLNEKKPKKKT